MKLVPAALMVMAATAAATPASATEAGVAEQEADWRRVATPGDRERIRQWRSAWMSALPAARAGGGRVELDADAALFDPDGVMDGAMPPAGAYLCRLFRMGRVGALVSAFSAESAVPCRIGSTGRRFAVGNGPARASGTFYPDTASRGVFLGTVMLADERRPMAYGRDARRDAAGLVERIGPERWRLVLPYPRFGSVLDVVEIVPAG